MYNSTFGETKWQLHWMVHNSKSSLGVSQSIPSQLSPYYITAQCDLFHRYLIDNEGFPKRQHGNMEANIKRMDSSKTTIFVYGGTS